MPKSDKILLVVSADAESVLERRSSDIRCGLAGQLHKPGQHPVENSTTVKVGRPDADRSYAKADSCYSGQNEAGCQALYQADYSENDGRPADADVGHSAQRVLISQGCHSEAEDG